MERNLHLNIEVNNTCKVKVDVIENESGESKTISGLYDSEKFRKELMSEIMSWITMWMDEEEDEENE